MFQIYFIEENLHNLGELDRRNFKYLSEHNVKLKINSFIIILLENKYVKL